MKKLSLILILLFAFLVTADTTIVNTSGLNIVPNNLVPLTIFDGTGDTITDSTLYTFGPYRVAGSKYEGMYAGYQFFSDAIGGTTPGVAIAYQLSHSSDTADIIAGNWVTTDSLAATGSTDYVDLTSNAGRYIYIRVHNYGANDAYFEKLKILFKKVD